ncbi:hypothetical protein CC78DRAFT_621666 [Lojkania enalia]|uniref:Uncharacterized protein n=1 Tax=Lojkania enalia TaxID=147567 RepID=A0A9P4JY38_9PLEO|nr:hypothetical protein CC78DRAFT_621666 [Didymosphaeria enalia]
MKTIISVILLASALGARAIDTSKAYQLRLSGSQNKDVADSIITLKDLSDSIDPNALGIWSDRTAHPSFTFMLSTAATDDRFYVLHGMPDEFNDVKNTRLVVWGDNRAMGLWDIPTGATPETKEGQTLFDDKWIIVDGYLKHAQDFNSAGVTQPSGGAGSWRICGGPNDYLMYWYDGSSELPIDNCEGVQLEVVEAAVTPTASISGAWLTGVPAPSQTLGPFITGVPAPSNASSTIRPTGTPNPFEDAASSAKVGGLLGLVLGVLAIAL